MSITRKVHRFPGIFLDISQTHPMKETHETAFEPMPEPPAEPQSPAPEPAPGERRAAELAEARRNIAAGLLWCAGGLAFSFLSYYLTSEGGRYFVATGAIIWGLIQSCRGLFIWLKIKYQNGEYAAFWRMAGAAVCTVVLIGYLFTLSSRLIGGEEMTLLDTEQTYECPQTGVRLTFPAGYAALETTEDPETDTTYASYRVNTWNDDIGITVEGVPGYLPPDVSDIGELTEYCQQLDSAYYDGGFIAPTQPVTIGGHEMLYSEGHITDNLELVYANYYLINGQTFITVCLRYPESVYGKAATRKRIERLLGGIRLTEPQAATE